MHSHEHFFFSFLLHTLLHTLLLNFSWIRMCVVTFFYYLKAFSFTRRDISKMNTRREVAAFPFFERSLNNSKSKNTNNKNNNNAFWENIQHCWKVLFSKIRFSEYISCDSLIQIDDLKALSQNNLQRQNERRHIVIQIKHRQRKQLPSLLWLLRRDGCHCLWNELNGLRLGHSKLAVTAVHAIVQYVNNDFASFSRYQIALPLASVKSFSHFTRKNEKKEWKMDRK